MFSTLLLLILIHASSTSSLLAAAEEGAAVSVGDEICIGGYVMDTYCINLGNLLDNSAVRTLGPDGPIKHSVHCLVDVGRCYNSPFNVLVELENGDYASAWQMDDNEAVLNHARSIGVCDTCQAGNSVNAGHISNGYRATFKGKVTSLGGGSQPATFAVTEVLEYSALNATCGNSTTPTIPNKVTEGDSDAASFQRNMLIHGSLMLIGWGFLLPSGAIIAKFGKHLPDAWWFKAHKTIQPIGLLFALIGWIVALVNFDTLQTAKGDDGVARPHAVLGMVTMTIGLAQPINAMFRPHVTDEGESKAPLRFAWEIFHKGLGWIGVVLAMVTIAMGTTLLPSAGDQLTFQICYGVLVGGLLLLMVVFLSKSKDT